MGLYQHRCLDISAQGPALGQAGSILESFRKILADIARIVESRTTSAGGRVIFLNERRP